MSAFRASLNSLDFSFPENAKNASGKDSLNFSFGRLRAYGPMGPGPMGPWALGPWATKREVESIYSGGIFGIFWKREVSTIFSGAIFDIQVWNEEGAGLRRVRFLKNDIPFFILVVSVSFWTPQAWNEEGAGLRRVRFLKNDMSFLILVISAISWTPQAPGG